MSQVGFPCIDDIVGNWASTWVRIAPLVGVRVSTCKSPRVGCEKGILALGGPRKIAFSVLAYTVAINEHMKTRCINIMTRYVFMVNHYVYRR